MLPTFREIWAVDFEFGLGSGVGSGEHPDPLCFEFGLGSGVGSGEHPDPLCLCARELRSGREIRLWRGQFGSVPPYPIDADSLFVAYYASAELGCHLALGWPMPTRILDLFTEFRCGTNGLTVPAGNGLIGALTAFGLDTMGTTEKKEMQEAIGNGTWEGRYTPEEILTYCMSDVDALARLLPVMAPRIDLPRALLRGRYMAAAAHMEYAGTPIDMPMLEKLRRYWVPIQDKLIERIDADYGVYEGRTFKEEKFETYLVRAGIPWPRLESGRLALDESTFRQMAKAHPAISPLRELRSSLAELRLNDLAVGRDGRNRVILSAFQARTGRNQPSSSRYIFGPSVWIRSLIKPPPGAAIAYIDYEQQEFAIAAKLSGDPNMLAAYASGDPYLAFAKQAGAIPSDGTRKTHEGVRELYKQCVLGVAYGMEAQGLALKIDQPLIVARGLLRAYHETYRQFWRWSDAVVDHAKLTGELHTVFGWTLHGCCGANPRSLRNFQMQAHGSELLRLACCLATERGIEVCGPVHDALLVMAPIEEIEVAVVVTRKAMAEASRIVLNGFEVRTDAKITRYPDRFSDPRGERMWNVVTQLIEEAEAVVNDRKVA
jgi:DNA polymerase I